MSEIYPGCMLIQFDKNEQAIPVGRVVACDARMGEAVVVPLRQRPKVGRRVYYVKSPMRVGLAALRTDIGKRSLAVVRYEPPSHQLLQPAQLAVRKEDDTAPDLNRRTRRELRNWYARAMDLFELIRPFVEGRTIEEIAFDPKRRGWPQRRARELGCKCAPKISRTLNAYILGMGEMPGALLPGYAYSGAPGRRKLSERKTGKPREESSKPTPDAVGRNCDEEVRKLFALGWKKFRKPGESVAEAFHKTKHRYFADSVSYDGVTAKVKLKKEAEEYSVEQFQYWGERADEILDTKGKALVLSPEALRRAARMGSMKGRFPAYNDEAFVDSTAADQTLVSCASRLKVLGSPWRTVIMGGAVNYIFGVHLGFENVASMTALLAILHAAEDKVDFCARYGIHIEPDDWLATTFHRHPVDNGEVKGSDAMAALQEAEAGAHFGPAYVALNKSPLESNHKVTQVRLDHRTPGSTMGRIKERGEPARAELARLNFHEYMGQVIKDILYHNNEEIIDLPTLEMRRAGVEPTRRGVILWMQQNGYVASTPRNLDVLRVRCLPSLRGVIHQDGVYVLDPTTKTRRLIPNLVYRSEWLNRNVLHSYKGAKDVKLYLDPSHPSEAWIHLEGLHKVELVTHDPEMRELTLLDWLSLMHDKRLAGYLGRTAKAQAAVNRIEALGRATARADKERKAELRELAEQGKVPSKTAQRKGIRQNKAEELAAMSGMPRFVQSLQGEATAGAAAHEASHTPLTLLSEAPVHDPFAALINQSMQRGQDPSNPQEQTP